MDQAVQSSANLTEHFTLYEATRSDKATELNISNIPNMEDLATIHRTAMRMELVRKILGLPINVSSWYRGPVLNKAVGGVPNSQHQKGEAVDFNCTGKSPFAICQILRDNAGQLQYDQLILEPHWTHISFCTSHSSQSVAPRLQYVDLSTRKR